ncbi:hypothetical protein ACOMHN_015129 [Nucella lapillus]
MPMEEAEEKSQEQQTRTGEYRTEDKPQTCQNNRPGQGSIGQKTSHRHVRTTEQDRGVSDRRQATDMSEQQSRTGEYRTEDMPQNVR